MSEADQPAAFVTTQWSLVAAAGHASPEQRLALETLCSTYWYPLYAFLRRRGHSADEAQDLTQAFFAELLARDRLRVADQERGRFRSFLLASLTHFVSNERRRGHAQKRGGRVRHLPLDFEDGESRYRAEPYHECTAEHIFDRHWALTVLDAAVERVRSEYESTGKLTLFEALTPHLGVGSQPSSYAAIAADLGMTEGAVKAAAHRLRVRCRAALRSEVAATVEKEEDVDAELQHLFAVI